MKKILVIATGWHFSSHFYENMIKQIIPDGWEVDYFCVSHRDPSIAKEEKQEIMVDILVSNGYSKKEIQTLLDDVYKRGKSDKMVEALGIPKNVDEYVYAESVGFHPYIEASQARKNKGE